MREISCLVAAATMVVCLTTSSWAQSALEGPLSPPGETTTAPVSKPAAKPKHHKTAKTAHRDVPKADTPDYGAAALPDAHPVANATSTPSNPVDFGMKWNGSSDSARETRVQNYNGDAEGTGAEVGMKLHF